MGDCNIKVIVRFRPMNQREISLGKSNVNLDFKSPTNLEITGALPQGQSSVTFDFDRIFPPTCTQEEVFNGLAKPTVKDILGGFNGTIFAYGQTGAGKSFTMMGASIDDMELRGIIPRASAEIFNVIAGDKSGVEYQVKVSYFEIYNEMIQDLLDPSKKNLKVHESPSRGVYIADLTEEYCAHEGEIYDFLDVGATNRAVASTQMNAVSSRSHSVFIIYVQQKNTDGSTKIGRFNLVDLAGSEKVGKTGAVGQTLEEAKKINQSLSALGNCIHALTDSKKAHIPYRDSKLTRVLQDSLGGNTKTTLMCGASPHENNIEETISTLRFGARAKTIKNSVKANVQRSAAELQKMLDALKKELADSRGINAYLEKQIAWYQSVVTKPIPIELSQPPQLLLTNGDEVSEESADSAPTAGSDSQSGGVSKLRSAVPTASLEAIDRIAELQAELERARDEIETLKGDLVDKCEEADFQIKEVAELKHTNATLQSDLEIAREQLKEADRHRAEDKKKYDHMVKQKDEKISDLEEELNLAMNAKETAESKFDDLLKEVLALRAENARLLEENESSKLENEAMFEELAEMQESKTKDEEKIDKLEEECAKAKRRLTALQEELEEKEKAEEETFEALHDLETQLQALELQKQELDSVIQLKTTSESSLKQELEKAHVDLEEIMNELEDATTLMMETEESLQKTQRELEQLKKSGVTPSSSNETAPTPTPAVTVPPAPSSPAPVSHAHARRGVVFASEPPVIPALSDSTPQSKRVAVSLTETPFSISSSGSGGLNSTPAAPVRSRSRSSSLFVQPALKPTLTLGTLGGGGSAGGSTGGAGGASEKLTPAAAAAVFSARSGSVYHQLAEVQGQLAEANEKTQKLNETILKFESQVRRLTLDKETLEKKLEHEKTKVQTIQTKYNEEHAKVQTLQDELDSLQRSMEKKEKELHSITKDDEKKREHIVKMEAEIKDLKAKIDAYRTEVDLLKEEKSRVQSELKDEKTKHSLANQKLERSQKQVEELQAELAAAQDQQLTTERQCDELKRERDSLKLSVEQKDAAAKETLTLIESLQQQLTRPKRAIKPISSGSGNIHAAFAEKIEFGQHMLRRTGRLNKEPDS